MDHNEKLLLVSGVCLAAGFGLALALIPVKNGLETNRPDNVVREFVCEDDGGLTERHVGVEHATSDGVIWVLDYDNGDRAFYHQPSGETCKMEEYVAPAVVDDADKLLALKWGNGHEHQ